MIEIDYRLIYNYVQNIVCKIWLKNLVESSKLLSTIKIKL